MLCQVEVEVDAVGAGKLVGVAGGRPLLGAVARHQSCKAATVCAQAAGATLASVCSTWPMAASTCAACPQGASGAARGALW